VIPPQNNCVTDLVRPVVNNAVGDIGRQALYPAARHTANVSG
jgi:hypothetical protein